MLPRFFFQPIAHQTVFGKPETKVQPRRDVSFFPTRGLFPPTPNLPFLCLCAVQGVSFIQVGTVTVASWSTSPVSFRQGNPISKGLAGALATFPEATHTPSTRWFSVVGSNS